MHPDDFDTRVAFEEKVTTPNGGGGQVVTWREVGGDCKRWAILRLSQPRAADEVATASHVAGVTEYRLTVRVDTVTVTLTGDHRARVGGRVLAITSPPLPDRARGIITMHVQEGKPT